MSFSRRTSGRCERSEESRFLGVETLRFAQGIMANCKGQIINFNNSVIFVKIT